MFDKDNKFGFINNNESNNSNSSDIKNYVDEIGRASCRERV